MIGLIFELSQTFAYEFEALSYQIFEEFVEAIAIDAHHIEAENSVLTEPETADVQKFGRSDPSNTFLLCDIPDTLQAAVSCKVGAKWAPIYVDKKPHNGTIDKELTPLNEVCTAVPKCVIS